MRKTRNPGAIRWMALLLALVQPFAMAGCGQKDDPIETNPTEAPVPSTDSQVHVHAFADGVCQCGETSGFEGFALEVADGLQEVLLEDTEGGMVLTSANPAGEMQGIRLNKEFDAEYGRFYEVLYCFTSDVAGTVRFASEGGACYESGEYEVVAGENEIAVLFAAGEGSGGKVNTSLELGGLGQFRLTFTGISLKEL